MGKGNRTQNHEPICSNITRYEGGFTWEFVAPLGGRDSGRRHIIRLKFSRWWLVYLTKNLIKALKEEEAEVKRIRELMGVKDEA